MTYARIINGTMTHPYQVPAILKTPSRDHDLRSMRPDLLAAQTCEVGSPDFLAVALVASEALQALDASLATT